jgi:hypothetical protein
MQFTQMLIGLIRDARNRQPILTRLAERHAPESIDEGLSAAPPEVFNTSARMESTVGAFVSQSLREQTEAQMAAAAIALKRFHLAHNSYPATLEELAPIFLRHLPIDYMDGKNLRYRLNADGTYVLYSVGSDGIDNGGDAVPPPGIVEFTGSLGHGGLKEGRDWVWPRAATAEEVKGAEAREEAKAKEAKSRAPRHHAGK